MLDHVPLMQELEDLPGTKVDIGTRDALHQLIRDQVLAEAKPL